MTGGLTDASNEMPAPASYPVNAVQRLQASPRMTSTAGKEWDPVRDQKAANARDPSGLFAKLKPGARLLVQPAIPRSAEEHEYRVQQVDPDRALIQRRTNDPPLSISSSAVAQLHFSSDHTPSLVVLKGRVQWITASGQWALLPEQPPADSEFGLDKLANPDDPQVIHFVNQLRERGYSPWWVPKDSMQELLAQGAEIIYDKDGRYFRARDRHSEWILLGKRGHSNFLP